MKRYIPIVASLMVFSLISCGEVMDLTQPEKAEVTYSNITLSLYQTGKYDLYLDEPEYQYNYGGEKPLRKRSKGGIGCCRCQRVW